ncbi:hypothetical protein DC498_18855 [Terrimonas sp.]|uniref:hypothetical protein n=1 Tax=Terrimonas sp. TaxID=1914338 RepID=UPI000D50DB55|nr:hypothetical protein [Terrimonas sp.]PVD50655.1 hypothetical protein DC498_18855 [Terrimonas sp.]
MKNIFLLLVALGCFISCFAKKQPHLDGMPAAEEVIAKIKGTNPRETYARQIAALRILWQMIRLHEMDKYHSKDTPGETILLKDYSSWQKKLKDEYSAAYENLDDSAANASFRIYTYQLETGELKNYIIENLFNEAAKKKYYEIKDYNKKLSDISDKRILEQLKIEKQRRENEQKLEYRESTNTLRRTIGMTLMIVPMLVYILWVGRRQFNRTNQYGVREYKSWVEVVFSGTLEALAGIGAGILFLLGVWLLILSYGN